jgi:hypothetical protein
MELLFSHLLEFVLAVLSGWKTLMAGVIFFAASLPNNLLSPKHREEVDRFVAPETRRRILLGLSGLCLFLACFQAWDSEHRDVRSLSDSQKTKLVAEFAKLKSITTYVVIAFTNGDHESGTYMQDFADAIRRAGLEPRYGFTSQDDRDQVGVIIALRDPKLPPPETELLRVALQSIGIEPKILGFPSAGFSVSGVDTFRPNIVLWVAERPLG